MPRFLPRQSAAGQENVTSNGAEQKSIEPLSEAQVFESEARLQSISCDLDQANGDLRECRSDIEKKNKALEELKLLEERSQGPVVSGAISLLMAIIGLVPGWMIADATVGVLGVVFFCPLTVTAFLIMANLMGFRVYRSRETLFALIGTGEIAESQLSGRQKDVAQLTDGYRQAVTKATDSRRDYENKLRRQEAELRVKRLREEQLARTPQPIELTATSKVDTSNAKALGTGGEWVYAYSFASQMSGEMFPIKVGMTSRTDVNKRIDEQMAGTSMPERAKVLLLFRVPGGLTAEKRFHKALKGKGRHMSAAVGTEWFKTNPEELLGLYNEFLSSSQI